MPLAHSISRAARSGLFAAALACLGPITVSGHATHEARIALIAEQLAQRPNDPELHFQLAQVNCEHGDWEIALINLSVVEKLAPGTFPTPLVRAEALVVGAKLPRAVVVLDAWIAAHPAHPGALLLRARTRTQLGAAEAALADYRAALAATPQAEPDLVQEVADALAAQGVAAEAARILAQGIERLGPIVSLMSRALALELAAGEFDAALARIAILQATSPRPEPWMTRRAEILTQAGRAAEARAAWQALLTHLAALPPPQRAAHAMALCAERAHQSLAALALAPNLTSAQPASSSSPR